MMIPLTANERLVLLFIAASVLVGNLCLIVVKRNPEARKIFEYSERYGLSQRVELNSSGAKELESVPYIGRATAKAIIARRERQGPFRSVNELLSVPGIGPRKLELIGPHVFVKDRED